jgi:hypothetical protein
VLASALLGIVARATQQPHVPGDLGVIFRGVERTVLLVEPVQQGAQRALTAAKRRLVPEHHVPEAYPR